jgi:polar amino acid transport system permease protein
LLIDASFLVGPRMLAALAEGMVLTFKVTLFAACGAFLIGTAVAVTRVAGGRIARAVAGGFVNFFRNTPLLIVLFFLYFGLPGLLPRSSFPALYGGHYEVAVTVAAVSMVSGAFVSEVLRAGIEAVPSGQFEAAAATGLRRAQAFQHVVFPQLAPITLPSLSNEAINIVKNSTYGMTIGLTELIWQAQQIEAETFKGFEAMTAVTLAFLAINGGIFALFWALERIVRVP